MEVVGGVSSVITLVEVAGKIGILCARYIKEVRSAQDEAERLRTEAKVLEDLLTKVDNLLKGPSGAKLEASRGLRDVLKNSKNVLEDLQRRLERGQASKTSRFLSKLPESFKVESLVWPFKKSNINKVFDNLETLKKDITLALVVDGVALDAARDQSKNIDKLGDASVKEAMFGSVQDQEEPKCLPQTRIEVLKTIETWVTGPRDSNIFWLRGIAGTGKSTIARTVALNLESTCQLGASFFFKKSEAGRNNALKLFPTLAYGLVKYLPELLPHVSKAIEDDFDTLKRSFKEQFERFLLEPLSKISCNSTVVIIIDALDECENEREIPLILGPLARLSELKDIDVRVFITSRPDHAPSTGFERLSQQKIRYHDLALHNVALATVRHDIRVFLTHEFACIRDRRYGKSKKITNDWPGDLVIEQLVQIAEPWFISAATICRFIDDNNERHFSPIQRLETILASGCKASGVYRIYVTIFEQIFQSLDDLSIQDRETIIQETQKILSTIIMLESPLSRNSLSDLIDMEEETIHYRLQALRSILKVPANSDGLVQTFHLSFRDFLLDEKLRTENTSPLNLQGYFAVDEAATHQSLAKDCIRLLSQNLKRDICNLKFAGPLRLTEDLENKRKSISASLEYACKYWIHHVKKSQCLLEDDGDVHGFLQIHLLHWLEATIQKNGKAVKLMEFLRDIERFIRYNQSIIAEAPLQAYMSALLFSPERSVVKALFSPSCLSWVRKTPAIKDNWGLQLQTLEGHKRVVLSVVFSPDSRQLASASYDGTIRLWDTVSGLNTHTLEDNSVRSVTFSLDGEWLVSGSSGKIKIWNVASGGLIQTTEARENEDTTSLAFSLDRRYLASGFTDGIVELRNSSSLVLLQTFMGHEGFVSCVTFSPDSKMLASVSFDFKIRLWDVKGGTLLRILHGSSPCSVVFLANGTSLASASLDSGISLWDVNSGRLIQKIRQLSSTVSSLSLSPDGRGLMSATIRGEIQLWDMRTDPKTLVRQINDHSGNVTSVAFSPDGMLFATSSEQTTKLWDATKLWEKSDFVHTQSENSSGKTNGDRSIGSSDITQTHGKRVFQGQIVGLSPERHLGAVGSESLNPKTIELWDLISGTRMITFDLQGSSSIVSWSSNKKIATASHSSIQLWNASSGVLMHTLQDHIGGVMWISFSPDSQLLASGSLEGTVKLWDVDSGVVLKTLEHIISPDTGVFSPNGTILASLGIHDRVRLWDPLSGALLYAKDSGLDIEAAAFSQDSSQLVTISDTVIDLWNIDGASRALTHLYRVNNPRESMLNPIEQNQTEFKISCTGLNFKTEHISFLPDGTALRLDTGFIDMRLLGPDPGRVAFFPGQERYFCDADGWLHWGINPVKSLWFPVGYRPEELYRHGNLFVILTDSGRLEHLEIDEDVLAQYF
ncbi:hypothetical protein TWF506_008692 [Arthrobotrys conoides]|uniref:NACHT domain-containing protein n=1 Tax=Arthrobotrys conoides TaxID=74498 RepID=A0AAN8RXM7_9PEZI